MRRNKKVPKCQQHDSNEACWAENQSFVGQKERVKGTNVKNTRQGQLQCLAKQQMRGTGRVEIDRKPFLRKETKIVLFK